MFETYKSLGEDKAEIYAEVVRTVMAEHLKVPMIDSKLKDKL